MLKSALSLAVALSACASAVAAPLTDAALAQVVDQRLAGDRTGACFAVAVIDGSHVARSYRCANADAPPRIGADSAFEIGSVSKTMTAALLADLIAEGRASLDDPLSAYLPEGTAVPEYQGQPIRLRHIVTHTSGLPALPTRMQGADTANPYAALDDGALLASLGDVTLAQAPGSRFEYSNFASMLLSYAVARRAGQPFEALLDARVFTPLAMQGAYIAQPPAGVRAASGHLPGGQVTPPWTFPDALAGVGGARATLDDMVRYVRAQLGDAPGNAATATVAALKRTQQPVSEQPPMAMHWMRVQVNGREALMHEGGTGGFSALVGFDPGRERGVVVLSDTALTALGGLGSLGLHLLDPAVPIGAPRRATTPPDAVLDGLVGTWRLGPDMQVELARAGDTLTIRPDGQPTFELGYDDAGDFYPLQFDALLSPRRAADGRYAFAWHQGGAVIAATRVDAAATSAPALSADELAAYAGVYTLMPGFALTIDAADGRLRAQATGQGAFLLDATGRDRFAAPAFGIELQFERGPDGAVRALELHQGGRVQRGPRG